MISIENEKEVYYEELSDLSMNNSDLMEAEIFKDVKEAMMPIQNQVGLRNL